MAIGRGYIIEKTRFDREIYFRRQESRRRETTKDAFQGAAAGPGMPPRCQVLPTRPHPYPVPRPAGAPTPVSIVCFPAPSQGSASGAWIFQQGLCGGLTKCSLGGVRAVLICRKAVELFYAAVWCPWARSVAQWQETRGANDDGTEGQSALGTETCGHSC